MEQIYPEETAARILGVSPRSLQTWRWRGGGPPFIRLGGKTRGPVRYTHSDLQNYLDERRRTSTSDQGDGPASRRSRLALPVPRPQG